MCKSRIAVRPADRESRLVITRSSQLRVLGLSTATLALLAACEGGQTGTPDGRSPVTYDAGCRSVAADLDASTPLGFASQQIWDAFEGSRETVAYWRRLAPLVAAAPEAPRLGAASYDELDSDAAVSLRIDIERDVDAGLPPVHCDNRVGAPVHVHLETSDGLLDADFDAVLIGEPGRARLELELELGTEVTGWIELGEPIALELQPLGDPARSLIAPVPCGGDAQWPLDDPRWGVTPRSILDALSLHTPVLQLRPEGSARVQLEWVAARVTACRSDANAHLPVQLNVPRTSTNRPHRGPPATASVSRSGPARCLLSARGSCGLSRSASCVALPVL